ncbi:flagellar filament capping protein FliD [Paraburkholderia solisilvae]|uniref:Flagellar hook-associated protein 2 n=1 Tax=Paraburkholderia solisilvae TaxID=624376 RepID=A0A6J5ET02_9BURK|nr:flagellar filament capping protein FliD [Paraburkholderia solisilvae]CAB3768125.1 B-type flagellar hook-associated protein 2 [Paraburkholderia solisilvae]
MSSTSSLTPLQQQAASNAAAQAALQEAAQSLISASTGTPLDTSSIISALVNDKVSGQGTAIKTKQGIDTTQFTALGTLSSALSGLQSSLKPFLSGAALSSLTATASASGITATTGTGATAATYQVTTSQIATAQTITSGAFSSADANAMGTGTLTISLGTGTPFTVNIDSSNDSLSDIATAINQAAGNTGIKAQVIKGANGGEALSLQSTSPGAANTISVSVGSGATGQLANLGVTSTPGTDLTASGQPNTAGSPPGSLSTITSTSGGWTQSQAAGDALLTINGTVVTNSTNTISNAVTGLTLTLSAAATQTDNQSQTITVSPDNDSVDTDLSSFVSAYNAVIEEMNSLAAPMVNQNVPGSGGALLGDEMINQLGAALGNIVGSQVSSGGLKDTLASLGITFQANTNGQPFAELQIDANPDNPSLDDAVATNPAALANLFNSTNGIADKLNSLVTTYTDPQKGLITSRTQALTDDLANLAKQQDDLQDYTNQLTSMYQDQFTSLNTLMSTANTNSNYLDALFGSGNNPGALSQGSGG